MPQSLISKSFKTFTLLLIFTVNRGNAQSFDLGWKGNKVLVDSIWTNAKLWNAGSSVGDQIKVTHDSNQINLHWKFGPGNRAKWVVYYLRLKTPLSFSDSTIFGMDVKGTLCGKDNRDVSLKFEDGTNQAIFTSHGLASINRWVNRISVLKKQFAGSPNWNKISVVAFAISSDPSGSDILADSGVVSLRNLQCSNAANWPKAKSLSYIHPSKQLDSIKSQTIQAILDRQVGNGLFYSWKEDNGSWLYGHGLVLKVLSLEGTWQNGIPTNACASAAKKLAQFLITQQSVTGYWPRAWYTQQGIVRYVDDYIWMGDFPWIISGLVNYHLQSGDASVLPVIFKAQTFLNSLIEPSGKLFTVHSKNGTKIQVTSTEAYAAVIQSLYELGDTGRARVLTGYIHQKTWDPQLGYFKEAIDAARPTLFSNTWMAMLNHYLPDNSVQLGALSFVGKALHTRGSGQLDGFDGIGPIATWLEGTLTYICAGGPNCQSLLDSLLKFRLKDGSLPSYSDSLGGKGDIWAVTWSSLDATAWLYYVSAGKSPFERYGNYTSPLAVKRLNEKTVEIQPNPGTTLLQIKSDNPFKSLAVYNLSGEKITTVNQINTTTFELNTTKFESGTYILEIISNTNTTIRNKWIKL